MKPEMSGEMQKLRDVFATKVHVDHTTCTEDYFTQGFDRCHGLMSAENAKQQVQLGIAIYALKDYAKSKQHGASAQVALDRIKEFGETAFNESENVTRVTEREAKLKKKLERAVEALEDADEFINGVQDNLFHYFENKCIPTIDEVNAPVSNSAGIRVVIAELKKELEAE